MKLDGPQRRELSKALFDIGKLAFAISVATPLVSAGVAGWRAAVIGGVFVTSLFIIAIATRLAKEIR